MRSWLLKRIYIIAQAAHVGMAGKYVIELAKIPPRWMWLLEFRYCDPILVEDSMVVIISQSGETADSLAALRLARDRNVPYLACHRCRLQDCKRERLYVIYLCRT